MIQGRPRPGADARVPLVAAPSKFCPRKLSKEPGKPNVKRYLGAPRPLGGYMVACPGCGFQEMHMHPRSGFVEEPDTAAEGVLLVGMTNPPSCMYCNRKITVEREPNGSVMLCATLPHSSL